MFTDIHCHILSTSYFNPEDMVFRDAWKFIPGTYRYFCRQKSAYSALSNGHMWLHLLFSAAFFQGTGFFPGCWKTVWLYSRSFSLRCFIDCTAFDLHLCTRQ